MRDCSQGHARAPLGGNDSAFPSFNYAGGVMFRNPPPSINFVQVFFPSFQSPSRKTCRFNSQPLATASCFNLAVQCCSSDSYSCSVVADSVDVIQVQLGGLTQSQPRRGISYLRWNNQANRHPFQPGRLPCRDCRFGIPTDQPGFVGNRFQDEIDTRYMNIHIVHPVTFSCVVTRRPQFIHIRLRNIRPPHVFRV